MIVSEPLPHFVEDLLSYLYEAQPTHATLDGVHTHDDLLEDLSRQGVESHTHALSGYLRRLEEINVAGLTEVERLDHRMIGSNLRARMLELEEIRTWEKNPQYYSDILASSLAGQALFNHAPPEERARRVLSKLRQTPRLIQAARDNITDPPGIFVKVGLETMRGALKFVEDDLPKAFSSVDDMHLLGDLADAQAEASQSIGAYLQYLETEVAPRARSSFRLGREKFEQKLKLDEGITVSLDRLLAIATRELHATQEEFRSVAGRMNGGDPLEAWARTKADHPEPGELVNVARQQLEELATFLERQNIISLPAGRGDHGGADAGFLPVVVREHVDARALRSESDPRLLLPDGRRSLVAARTPARISARLQPPDAVVDLDSRGVPGALPPLPASAPRRVQGSQVDDVRGGVVCRRVGALLRRDDDRGRLRAAAAQHQARPAGRIARPPRAVHRLHPAAR